MKCHIFLIFILQTYSCCQREKTAFLNFEEKKYINDYVESLDECITNLNIVKADIKNIVDLMYNQKQIDNDSISKYYKLIEALSIFKEKLNERHYNYKTLKNRLQNESILRKVATYESLLYRAVFETRIILDIIEEINTNHKYKFDQELLNFFNTLIELINYFSRFKFGDNLSDTAF